MTILIGVVLPEAAFVISDGRHTNPYENHRVLSDDVTKTEVVNYGLAVGAAGIAQATGPALTYLKKVVSDPVSPSETLQELAAAIKCGWSAFLSQRDSTVDLKTPDCVGLLVAAGLYRQISFVAVAMIDELHGMQQQLFHAPYDAYVHGGAPCQPLTGMSTILAAQRALPGANLPDDKVNKAVLDGAAAIIRGCTSDPAVGGTIRYVLLTRPRIHQW